jgi:hypothetical protein
VTFFGTRAFTPSMDENELTRRMRAIGEQPVPDTTRNLHLHRMAGVPAAPTKRFGRFAVAAAAVVGFMAGSTGLAMAGALPAPAQDVAHDVLSTVNLEVPAGKEGKRGPCVSAIAKDTSLTEEQKAAKKDADCPKGPFGPPAHAGQGGQGENPGKGRADAAKAGDGCRGKPPWAGRDDLTEAQTDAMAAERNAACGRGKGNGKPDSGAAEGSEAPAPQQTPAAPPAEEMPVAPEAETVEPEAEVVEPPPTEEPAPEGTEEPTDDGQG